MKHPDQTGIVYNTIKAESGLNEASLSLLGITRDKLDSVLHQFIKSGLSHKEAIRATVKLWRTADPNSRPVTPKEMTMMGFELTPEHNWKHMDVDITLTPEEANSKSFSTIESMILDAKQNDSQPPSEDNKTE